MVKDRVVVIGAGLAGMLAAAAAAERGAAVTLLDRGGIGLGSNSAMANGVLAGPTSAYGPEQYVKDTMAIGNQLNVRSYVEQVAASVPASYEFLAGLGVELTEGENFWVVHSPQIDVLRGVNMVRAAAAGLKGCVGVQRRAGFCVLEIVTDGSRAVGVRGLDKDGRAETIAAEAVVLAGGGAGAVYARNDNMRSSLGQAYYLAAQAGLGLMDMEFVQFYPVVLAEPGLPSVMIYPRYPAQARIIDARGEDLLAKHGVSDLNQAIMSMRDKFSALLHREAQAGPVKMDLTRVPAELWQTYPLGLLSRMKFDFKNQPVSIGPGAHFCMGGVAIDAGGMTELTGLFACGEVVWGLHGANRRGGNALCECVVSGCLAGQGAAGFATANPAGEAALAAPPVPAGQSGQDFPYRSLLKELREIAWHQAGVERGAEGMLAGLARLAELETKLRAEAREHGPSATQGLNLDSALFMVKAVLTASLARRESRGALLRSDFPEQDDAAWLVNSRLVLDSGSGELELSHLPAKG